MNKFPYIIILKKASFLIFRKIDIAELLPYSVFLYDFSVNLKSNFGKTKRDRNLIFVILDKSRVYDSHKIFR